MSPDPDRYKDSPMPWLEPPVPYQAYGSASVRRILVPFLVHISLPGEFDSCFSAPFSLNSSYFLHDQKFSDHSVIETLISRYTEVLCNSLTCFIKDVIDNFLKIFDVFCELNCILKKEAYGHESNHASSCNCIFSCRLCGISGQ